MSIATSSRVWLQSKQSGSALLVLLTLADRADDDGYCWPGMDDIAARARIDKRQAQRIIKQVEASGELHADRSYGRGRTSQYIVATGQEAQQIANTLTRRFDMDTTAAMQTAQEIISRQIKGDIHAQKVTPTPPFPAPIKGDIHAQKVTLKGDIHAQKVTPEVIKGDIHTTPIIINQQGEENISSSPLDDSSSSAQTEEKNRQAEKLWQTVLDELANSLPAPTYQTWVRDTNVLRYTGEEIVIGVPHVPAKDWLHNRLSSQIKRSLGHIAQQPIDVTFAVRPRPTTKEEPNQ